MLIAKWLINSQFVHTMEEGHHSAHCHFLAAGEGQVRP